MQTIKALAAVALLALIVPAPTLAQTESAAPNTRGAAATSGATMKGKAQPQRTAKSLDCSRQADTKKIHGKERRKFMSSCKKA